MFRIVLDTNVLVSATISEGNEYKLLESAKLGKIKIILSLQILREFEEVISRPKFGFFPKQIEDVFKQLLDISELVISPIKLSIVKEDPPDNRILECALAGKADYIVSRDNHLLELKKYKGIKIIRTSEILRLR